VCQAKRRKKEPCQNVTHAAALAVKCLRGAVTQDRVMLVLCIVVGELLLLTYHTKDFVKIVLSLLQTDVAHEKAIVHEKHERYEKNQS
jgi:hypothetical protein